MKKDIFKIILLMIFISLSIAKADVKSEMQKGNVYYKNNQYQLAIDKYDKLIKQGYQGTSLYYNLGNAHYRLGNVGYAILYYEKALKLSPNDEDVKHNLELARINIKDKVETLPPFFIFNIWESVLASLSVSGWTVFVYIVFILLLLCVIAYFFSRTSTQQRISFFSGVGVFAVLILAIILLAVKMNKEFNIKDGIIVSNVVTVKSSPDNSSKDEFIVHEGLKIRLEDKVDNWVKIRLADGKLGWIPEENLKQI
ncbi:MAG TPA: tetratricopeptide repeat protein [Ignavibacteriaceae bacterium]|nr:tetratricopeptide repeat protein [Ignavibacteriaceae bacterium]HRP91617.1 tetratricopeptide repeat protein [Ignavibacteriaceae bacterium]HRQ53052.1 tetratricopeptide repeat protein [Ignavibacteriaceae bacterium]